MRRTWAVAMKELRQIRRDRRTLLILVFVPTFFLFLYGYALNFDIRHIAMAVQDRDATDESRTLVETFVRSTYFDVAATVVEDRDVAAVVDRGTALMVLVIPGGFGRDLQAGRTASVQIIVNGDNANTATTVLGYVSAVLLQASAAMGPVRRAGTVFVEPRVWYNPELRSSVFLVPGLIAFISMITAVISTALSVVREKELGTMEQVRMAPISMAAFIVGKTVPYLLLSQVGATAIILAAEAFFRLPMHGDWFVLSLVIAIFLVGALGTGLLVSTIADTQEVAFQAAALVAMLPTLILSGFIFPISSMPVALQVISAVIPARYFLIALRGIVLKGLGLPALLGPIAALVIYAVAILALASVRLARR